MPAPQEPGHHTGPSGDDDLAARPLTTRSAAEPPTSSAIPLLRPVDGVPPVLNTPAELAVAVGLLRQGTGPVAVDAERASGFRYSPRAYLIQLRRAGSGTFLVDPIGLETALEPLAAVLAPLEWVLHAADQDLPGLADLGLHPARLFDTELGGRLAGIERVGLAAMTEQLLGQVLRKGHGAADWSRRPLPAAWLNYAALDVELLLPLRTAVADILESQGKTDWAAQEFEFVRTQKPAPPKSDPWRRTSGIHTLRVRRQLALVRELWLARDQLARARDLAPTRVLPDNAIIAAATANPRSLGQLRELPIFGGPRQRRHAGTWFAALDRARRLPESALPPLARPQTGPPPANRWQRRDPSAAHRLHQARAALSALSDQLAIPVENLLPPETLRRLCWDGVDPHLYASEETLAPAIATFLTTTPARQWQRTLTTPVLAKALASQTP